MIGLAIPMPEYCIDCPCSYWIGSGEYEGMMMCEALEKIKQSFDKDSYIVDEYEPRPKKCPMFELPANIGRRNTNAG